MKQRLRKFEKVALSIWFWSYTALVVAFDTTDAEHVDFETEAFYASGSEDSNIEVETLLDSGRGSLLLEELAASGVPSLEEITENDQKGGEELRQEAGEPTATEVEAVQAAIKDLSEKLPAGSPPPAALAAPNNARVQ